MKRRRDFDWNEDKFQNKRWKPSSCFPPELDDIILDYAVENPLDEFLDACIIGNLRMAEWIFDRFKLEKMDKKILTDRYEDKMSMARDKALFYWSAKKMEIYPNYENMVEKAINNLSSMSEEILRIAFGDNREKYMAIFMTRVIFSKNIGLFKEIKKKITRQNVRQIYNTIFHSENRNHRFSSEMILKFAYLSCDIPFDIKISTKICDSIRLMHQNNDIDEINKVLNSFNKEMKHFDEHGVYGISYFVILCELRPAIPPDVIKKLLVTITNRKRLLSDLPNRNKTVIDYLKLIPEKDAREISDLILGGW
jgi:hypothetical protein